MFPGRFWLGLGAGEALNEHVVGGHWPEIGVRSAMMFEAIEVMSKLFTGEVVKHAGKYFTLESAKLYTRPDEPVPIYVATAGPFNAKRTGKFADGMITVGAADEKIVMLWDKFDEGAREAGKDPIGKPKLLQLHVSWARNDRDAIHNALVEWPNGGMPFPKQDIRNPEDFAAMAKMVQPGGLREPRPDDVRSRDARAPSSSTTSTWASTRSTCTTSAATRPSSSRCSGARCCRSCARRRRRRPRRRAARADAGSDGRV